MSKKNVRKKDKAVDKLLSENKFNLKLIKPIFWQNKTISSKKKEISLGGCVRKNIKCHKINRDIAHFLNKLFYLL